MSAFCSYVLQCWILISPSVIKLLIKGNLMSMYLVCPCNVGFFAIEMVDLLSHKINVASFCSCPMSHNKHLIQMAQQAIEVMVTHSASIIKSIVTSCLLELQVTVREKESSQGFLEFKSSYYLHDNYAMHIYGLYHGTAYTKSGMLTHISRQRSNNFRLSHKTNLLTHTSIKKTHACINATLPHHQLQINLNTSLSAEQATRLSS